MEGEDGQLLLMRTSILDQDDLSAICWQQVELKPDLAASALKSDIGDKLEHLLMTCLRCDGNG